MGRFFVAALAAALFAALAPAAMAAGITTGAGVWQWQKPIPQGNQMWDIDALPGETGWAVGAAGTALRTLDAGATWSSAGPRTSDYLIGVDFVDAQHGWICGADGVFWRTSDAGATWKRTDTGSGVDFWGVSFFDSQHGCAVGDSGHVARTTDGGAHWSVATVTDVYADLRDVRMVSATQAWAVGGASTLLRTTNGGKTWQLRPPVVSPELGYVALNAIAGLDSQHLYIVGSDGTVLVSSSGGADWVRGNSGATWAELTDVAFADEGNGWAVGQDGVVLHTIDGGLTWGGQDNGGISAMMQGVAAWSGLKACYLGYQGYLGFTANGGATWVPVSNDTRRNFNDVDAVDAEHVFVAGYAGELRRSADGGASWTDISYPTITGHLNGIDFVDTLRGWAVGDDGQVLSTANAGASWTLQALAPYPKLEDVSFGDGGHGWAVGVNGRIFATSNGVDWGLQDAGTTTWFLGVDAPDASHVWAVGVGGMIYHTDTGGADPDAGGPAVGWNVQPGAGYDLNDVFFLDANNGWAVGNAGTIIHTSTGGEDPDGAGPLTGWSSQSAGIWGSAGDLYDVCFADALHGWAVGAYGVVLATSDGGATWTSQSSGCLNWLEGVACSDSGHVWAAGRAGTILFLPALTDSAPPATTTDAPKKWVNHAITVNFTATDAGSGTQFTRVDDGTSALLRTQLSFTVDAWQHTTDGVHTFSYASADNAGNREAEASGRVSIDTRRPNTKAPEAERVRRNSFVRLKYRVNDGKPNGGTAKVTIKIKTLRGVTKKTIKLSGTKKVNRALTYRFKCTLRPGTYRYYVYATDAAGNRQLKLGSNKLTVR